MCGIAGLFSANKINEIDKRIEKMHTSIEHRGPEVGKNVVINNRLALGHQRLKIIDLSDDANQPMKSNDNRYTIVFNGEIYNYKSIRDELDYSFNTESDTEVILAAIQKKGIKWFLKKSNGMFSIAVYDRKKNKITLIRDRLGIKPLYYTIKNNTLIFGSEIKAILNSGLFEPEFNESAIDLYLGYRYVLEPYTFFKEIYQVKSGTFLEFNLENENIKCNREIKYWELPRLNFQENYNEEELLNELEDKLTSSVNKRLVADVSLGTYLSGGVDSSLLTAMTSKMKNNRINTYTIGFPEKKYNEFEFSQQVAKKYNTKHHEILMNNEKYLDEWEELIYYKDAPLSVPNEVPLSNMSRKLKEKITVVLSGEGADELFGGYGRIFRSPFYYKNAYSGSLKPDEFFIDEYEYVSRNMRDKFLTINSDLRNEVDQTLKNMFEEYEFEESIFRFFHKIHIKGLLLRLDMTTMQTAVEGRVPFLDHELIEFVYKNLPYDLKLKWRSKESMNKAKKLTPKEFSEYLDIPKYALKQISYKYLPNEIIERKKMGFPVPLDKWLDNITKLAKEYLLNAYWLDNSKVEELIFEAKKNKRTGQIIWMFINVEMFRRKYFNKRWKW